MIDSQLFGRLSEAISAAAADPSFWPVFLEQFAVATRSNRMVLHREALGKSRQARFAFSYGAEGTFTEEYERYYSRRNPILAFGNSILVPGRPGLRQEICSEKVFLASEYYNDFLRPNDVLQIFGGVLIENGASILMLSGNGSHTREPYGDDDLRLLGALMPHLQTALLLQDRLGALGNRLATVEAAYDVNPDAVILVDGKGTILSANANARKLLLERDGVSADGDRIRITNRAADARLSNMLKGIALAELFGLDGQREGAVRVPRPSGAPDLLFQVFPTDKKMAGNAVIFVTGVAMTDAPSEADLQDLFGLSRMQRRIALRLFAGEPAGSLSEELGVTRNTLKTHTRRIFSKLSVSRQTELMRLFAKLKPREQRISAPAGGNKSESTGIR